MPWYIYCIVCLHWPRRWQWWNRCDFEPASWTRLDSKQASLSTLIGKSLLCRCDHLVAAFRLECFQYPCCAISCLEYHRSIWHASLDSPLYWYHAESVISSASNGWLLLYTRKCVSRSWSSLSWSVDTWPSKPSVSSRMSRWVAAVPEGVGHDIQLKGDKKRRDTQGYKRYKLI